MTGCFLIGSIKVPEIFYFSTSPFPSTDFREYNYQVSIQAKWQNNKHLNHTPPSYVFEIPSQPFSFPQKGEYFKQFYYFYSIIIEPQLHALNSNKHPMQVQKYCTFSLRSNEPGSLPCPPEFPAPGTRIVSPELTPAPDQQQNLRKKRTINKQLALNIYESHGPPKKQK